MAYKDSDELQSNENYALGEYSFRIERTSIPGSSNDQITAICTQGGKNARKSIQIPSSQNLDGWYVEANGTTADVYAIISGSSIVTYPFPQPVPCASTGTVTSSNVNYEEETTITCNGGVLTLWDRGDHLNVMAIYASASSGATYTLKQVTRDKSSGTEHTETWNPTPLNYQYTYLGETVYYTVSGTLSHYPNYVFSPNSGVVGPGNDNVPHQRETAWAMIYGNGPVGETLIGRFAIELEDAGGVGPGSDWIDPGDYDPDWEEGDPTHTLYVEVTGALSGRHNDPIEDPSYSYIPADKETVKDYGCGGDGGHGGGGGAGASTVVVHKFATNQANSKEVTAIARRHGYGSGGGKGGKGGDGCILVYY